MEVPFLLSKGVTLVLSLVVSYLAYHGYRRSGQTPMLYVSGGFVFIGVGAVCEGLIYQLFGTTIASAALVQAIVVSSGMVLILFSLVKQ
ncbi:DUF7521 family protein [Natronolimnohabitans innermongolicus]|uniref:Uncharacterized protein n=1 Tax=Natronolimnohabitans innermongolicus JCM 12255 TaxID=1227499 RepID=L9WLW1_9EURY|nr:hypothetical protein [Natronolimnohabitans innermongolicus]ELY50211.1 hypothetical protein C493_19631 [Natronolimnohabitans innermongolicus JCM 12255]